MQHRLIRFKSYSSNFRISHSVRIICIPSATHCVVFTPIHHCICFAWQNEKYWDLFREICQKNLRGSWVLHIFPVTLMKRNLFENLPRSAVVGHWMCVGSGSVGLSPIPVQKFVELLWIAQTEQFTKKPKFVCEQTEFHIKE